VLVKLQYTYEIYFGLGFFPGIYIFLLRFHHQPLKANINYLIGSKLANKSWKFRALVFQLNLGSVQLATDFFRQLCQEQMQIWIRYLFLPVSGGGIPIESEKRLNLLLCSVKKAYISINMSNAMCSFEFPVLCFQRINVISLKSERKCGESILFTCPHVTHILASHSSQNRWIGGVAVIMLLWV